MEFKGGLMILINLAILGTVIAAAVYIFQIGNGDRSVKCTAVDKFGEGCVTGGQDIIPCTEVSCSAQGECVPGICGNGKRGRWKDVKRTRWFPGGKKCQCDSGETGVLKNFSSEENNNKKFGGNGACKFNTEGKATNTPCGGGTCDPDV